MNENLPRGDSRENENLDARLNQIYERITSKDFLRGRGLSNEIAFTIFDYPAARELEVRCFITKLESDLATKRPDLRVRHVNLFDLILQVLDERDLREKAFELQRKKGDAALRSALEGALQSEKLAQVFVRLAPPDECDLVLVSGVGNAFPLLRSHNLLNSLHALTGQTPLLMFFPGTYRKGGLSLFNILPPDSYYRAFKLVE